MRRGWYHLQCHLSQALTMMRISHCAVFHRVKAFFSCNLLRSAMNVWREAVEEAQRMWEVIQMEEKRYQ